MISSDFWYIVKQIISHEEVKPAYAADMYIMSKTLIWLWSKLH